MWKPSGMLDLDRSWFICLLLITCGECILTPVPLIYPASDNGSATWSEGAENVEGGGGGWRPSPEFIVPHQNSKPIHTKLGLNVTVPVKRHVYDYGTGNDPQYGFKYPPYNDDLDGNWPPISGAGPISGPVPGSLPPPAPVPVPGVGYQNYPYPYPYPGPLAVRPPIQQDLLLKTLLVPLTGAALLGVAAFLVTNPVLFKLGVVAGRRRRSAAPPTLHKEADDTLTDFLTLRRFMTRLPPGEAQRNNNKMLANYLICSGLTADSRCLEKLACQAALKELTTSLELEEKITQIVLKEILQNIYIPQDVKAKVEQARRIGLTTSNCSFFVCRDLKHFL